MTQQLYRLYNADDELLYVGISMSALNRIGQHKAEKTWWHEVAKITIETHMVPRAGIEEMERQAIQAESPRYNKKHVANARSKSTGAPVKTSAWVGIGDVIAAGMRDRDDCPIGMIVADSTTDERLARGQLALKLFHFGTGDFSAGYQVVDIADVRAIKVAELVEDEWHGTNELIYDTARLGAFQTEWKRRHSVESAV